MTENIRPTPAARRRQAGRGEPLLPDEPGTLAELFLQAARKHDRADALNYKKDGQWRSISSSEMAERMGNIALGLYALGVRKGDRVAILASNSPEWTLTDGGCQFAGVIDVPIYTTLAGPSVCFILNNSGARVLFIEDEAAYERIADSISECAALEKIVFFDGGASVPRSMTLAELENDGRALRAAEAGLVDELIAAGRPGDVATLIYTSGTTGEPKGVMLSHTNIVSNVIDSGAKYSFSEADIPLSVLPLSHVFERTAMYLYILNGMCVHYAESIDKVPENLREVRPTIFVGVPRIFEKVYARAKLKAAENGGLKEKIFDWAIDIARRYARAKESAGGVPLTLSVRHAIADRLVYAKLRAFFGGRLRCCLTGGAALSDDIYLIFTGSGIMIIQGYGLTETSPVVSSNDPDESRLGTVGRPIRNMQVRIADDGEVEVHGPGVMLGYYNNEEANKKAFTDDGWLRTGDIGEMDKDGYLRITDRKKELFKTSGGKYIAPTPIEGMIRSSRFVNQAVLVGSERKYAAALVVPNFEMLASYARHKGLDLKTPRDFCQSPEINDLIGRQIDRSTDGLSKYETVKRFTLLENEFSVDGGEMTPTLKIKRRVVDEKYKDVIDRMYDDDEEPHQ